MARRVNSLVIVLVFSVVIFDVIYCHHDKYCTLDDTSKAEGYCGNNFAEILAILCHKGGGYNGKRSGGGTYQSHLAPYLTIPPIPVDMGARRKFSRGGGQGANPPTH